MTAWKDFERRSARMFGGERSGTLGRQCSDGDSACSVSLECKRTTRYSLRAAWITQARRQSKDEGRPWVLAISTHGDRAPIAVCDLAWLASVLGTSVEVADAQ